MTSSSREPQESIASLVKTRVTRLNADLTVEEALALLKNDESDDGGVLYLYVVDARGRLAGVLPTRRLLTAPNDQKLKAIALPSVITLTSRATVVEACEMFLKHKFLAFPVVDDDFRLIGMVDVSMFAEKIVDLTERKNADDVFELLGFRMSQLKRASALETWRYRFPWLLTTLASGTICAFLAGAFEQTLAHTMVIAFFLTLVLALGESVSIQAMTLTMQRLRFTRPSLRWFGRTLLGDSTVASLLALASAIVVSAVVLVWKGSPAVAGVIGSAVFLSLLAASALGLAVPSILHGLRLDPRVAAGPVTLALTDVCTILIYLVLSNAFL